MIEGVEILYFRTYPTAALKVYDMLRPFTLLAPSLHTVHAILRNPHATLRNPHVILRNTHATLRNPHATLRNPHDTGGQSRPAECQRCGTGL